MIFIRILVEGPTEQTFVASILNPYLVERDIFPTSVVLNTKITDVGKSFKGGVSNYQKIKRDLRSLLADSSHSLVTTMLDYYGLPKDFPRTEDVPDGTCFEKVEFLEQRFTDDINHSRFLPYLSLHEFEAMLFSLPQAIADQFPAERPLSKLSKIRNAFPTPEEINDKLPPSKRLEALFSGYQKIEHGNAIAAAIGIEIIRKECSHFDAWLTKLEGLPRS